MNPEDCRSPGGPDGTADMPRAVRAPSPSLQTRPILVQGHIGFSRHLSLLLHRTGRPSWCCHPWKSHPLGFSVGLLARMAATLSSREAAAGPTYRSEGAAKLTRGCHSYCLRDGRESRGLREEDGFGRLPEALREGLAQGRFVLPTFFSPSGIRVTTAILQAGLGPQLCMGALIPYGWPLMSQGVTDIRCPRHFWVLLLQGSPIFLLWHPVHDNLCLPPPLSLPPFIHIRA